MSLRQLVADLQECHWRDQGRKMTARRAVSSIEHAECTREGASWFWRRPYLRYFDFEPRSVRGTTGVPDQSQMLRDGGRLRADSRRFRRGGAHHGDDAGVPALCSHRSYKGLRLAATNP